MMKPTSDNPKIKSHAGETRTQQTRHKRSEKHKAKRTEQDDGKRHETKPRQKQCFRLPKERAPRTRARGAAQREPEEPQKLTRCSFVLDKAREAVPRLFCLKDNQYQSDVIRRLTCLSNVNQQIYSLGPFVFFGVAAKAEANSGKENIAWKAHL